MPYYLSRSRVSMAQVSYKRLHLLYFPQGEVQGVNEGRVSGGCSTSLASGSRLRGSDSFSSVVYRESSTFLKSCCCWCHPSSTTVSLLTFCLCLILQDANVSCELSGRWLYLILARTWAKVCCNLLWNICDFCCVFYCILLHWSMI